ncbi:MAG: hypothetical protein AMS15_02085 [Planctomycetes bacterium DG_23]|nr:MAG: hypothetical protein AMS15_02085 [Planctomycetes bacterium DG_23]
MTAWLSGNPSLVIGHLKLVLRILPFVPRLRIEGRVLSIQRVTRMTDDQIESAVGRVVPEPVFAIGLWRAQGRARLRYSKRPIAERKWLKQ